MIETEVLVEVYDSFERVQEVLDIFEKCGVKKTVDTYYYDPLRENLKPYADGKLYASFRIRQKGEDTYITYKNDHYLDGVWQYSDEYEVKTDDFLSTKLIVENLKLKQLLVIDSEKHFFKYGDYEIVLELVKDLGVFLEVELEKQIGAEQVSSFKAEIIQFISSLGISTSPELNAGKPELFIRKNGFI